ncbi:phospholipase A2, partial [Oesophagostomum dentatum]
VYNHYGCWCGKGGGGTPVDGIDMCCKTHDFCYRTARISKICSRIQLYFDNYDWNCMNNTAICAGKTPCEQALCKCDVDVVRCWGKYTKPDSKKKCEEE